jgi:hypothetical protein
MTSDTSININNNFQYPNLPVSIIWPDDPSEVPWFMARLYEQMAFAINSKDNGIFQMAISNTPTLIPNMNNIGSYLVNVGGTEEYVDEKGELNYWPTAIFQMTKTEPKQEGAITSPQTQDGRGPTLLDVALRVTQQKVPVNTGPYYYFIQHDGPNITGSFNVNIQGTQ